MPKWIRYRFYTHSVSDPRPLIHNRKYPWWCSGYAGDDSFAIIVAYLPVSESLFTYWDDAFNVEWTECNGPVYSSRFPRPTWLEEMGSEC